MRPYVVMRYVGMTLVMLSAVLFVVLGYCLAIGDGSWSIFFYSALIPLLVGLLPMIFVPRERQLTEREGYFVVVYAWLSVCFFGMIPYALYGEPFDLAAAWFESVSGFTTTGATFLSDVESLPKSLLLYRALTHWVGGMGVVVFVLLVSPSLGRARMTLSRSELSQIARQDYRQGTGKMLEQMGIVYLGLTLATMLCLLVFDVPLFDSIILSFSTVATGGFASKTMSVAAYDSVYVEGVLILFMVISSLHFGMLYSAFRGNWRIFFRSRVLRMLLAVLGVSIAAVTLDLHFSSSKGWAASFRESSFMLVSIMSTTGFATHDANLWPHFSQLILMAVLVIGGCSGSTAGGIKVDRLLIMFAGLRAYIRHLQHPQAVVRTRVGREIITEESVISTFVFLLSYVAVLISHTMFITLMGIDMKTAFSTSLACLSNAGPGLGQLSSFDSYSMFSGLAHVSYGLLMIVGRLEIFGLLIVLQKRFR